MPELTFLGLSEDATVILLADSRGRKYTVPLEARLRAALRVDVSSAGQMEIALNTLTPRDIQARLRAGATVAELADEAGVDVVRIERYAGPPLAEREHQASLARDTSIDSHLGERTLGVVVAAAAEADGVPVDTVRWDAWLREDGSWQVLSAYPMGKVDRVATWTFDARAHRIWADDREAEGMVAGGHGGTHRLSAVPDDQAAVLAPAPAKRTRKKSAAQSQPAVEAPDDVVVATNVDTAAQDMTEAPVEHAADDSGSADTEERATRKGRRASVPSWDEILFGGTPST